MQACRVLYLYAGAPRKSSVKAFLARMSKATGVAVYVTEMDIVRSKRHDLSRRHLQQRLLAAIKKQRYNALLASPPCNTFSRARHSAQPGPRPLRDINHPYGVPGLTAREKAAVRQGTVLAKFAIAAVHAQLASSATAMALLEHPEDLGTAARGRPASIWQWPEARALTNEPNAASIAIHQSSFGTACPKPTRLTGRLPDLHLVGAQGWPTFALKADTWARSPSRRPRLLCGDSLMTQASVPLAQPLGLASFANGWHSRSLRATRPRFAATGCAWGGDTIRAADRNTCALKR